MKTDKKWFEFEEVLSSIGGMAGRFSHTDIRGVKGFTELRFKTGCPPELFCGSKCLFVDHNGAISPCADISAAISKRDMAELFKALCGYSIHSHQEDVRRRFVTIRGGHRAGICGTAVFRNGKLENMRDITSVNIRVAKEVPGVADKVVKSAFKDGICGVLLAGPPCSGKTTIFRGLVRQLSYGALGRAVKIAVIDERGEIAAVWQGEPQNDMGAMH